MDMGDTNDVGRRVGMVVSILALGALAGPPISGAINTATGGFKAVGYFAGWMINHYCGGYSIVDAIYYQERPSLSALD